MATYLVTGGAGFIGSHFVRHVLREHADARVVNVDALTYAGNRENLADVEADARLAPRYTFVHADIRDRAALDKVFADHDPCYVVNFAAESHVDRSIQDPSAFASTNVMGTATLLDAARAAWAQPDGSFPRACRFLQVSTDEVYGSLPPDQPEQLFREDTPLDPHSPYAASKAAADLLVKAHHDTFGLPTLITRCANNYGSHQFPEKLIPLMVRNALRHDPLPVYGDGKAVRDWISVEDHCRAVDAVLQGGRVGDVYNVGARAERSCMEVVRAVVAACARIANDDAIDESLVRHVADRKAHDRRCGIDPGKLERELGWRPLVAFADGLEETVRWYVEHADWAECAQRRA